MPDFTEQERDTLRTGAFGAIILVSQADPGFFASMKESVAGSHALAEGPAELRDLLRHGGMPHVPKGDRAQQETAVLSALHEAVELLAARDTAWLASYQQVVRDAVNKTAAASHGVAQTETDMIAKIEEALTPAAA
jgi:hypothetical protein